MSLSASTLPLASRAALLAAATDVAENSLFALADACEAETFAAAAASSADGGDSWLTASVRFAGPIAGSFELTLPTPLARHLAASFAGADDGERFAEQELLDFTGELANMVCGTWLTRSFRHETFSLASPRVLRGQPATNEDGAAMPPVYLTVDDAPIRLALHAGDGGAADGRPHGA